MLSLTHNLFTRLAPSPHFIHFIKINIPACSNIGWAEQNDNKFIAHLHGAPVASRATRDGHNNGKKRRLLWKNEIKIGGAFGWGQADEQESQM